MTLIGYYKEKLAMINTLQLANLDRVRVMQIVKKEHRNKDNKPFNFPRKKIQKYSAKPRISILEKASLLKNILKHATDYIGHHGHHLMP
uniref:Uncharacterized protein n=1 Tax=Rhizophora mucronata TaxID=61149 RepID=A0A2P2N3S6_RHIMU